MKFKFPLQSILNHRESQERNAEIALGKEMQALAVLETERDNLISEFENLVKTRGGIDTKSAERFMDFINYTNDMKNRISLKLAEIIKQNEEVEKARKELVVKSQEKKAIEILRNNQKAAFKLSEKHKEAKITDEAAGRTKSKIAAD